MEARRGIQRALRATLSGEPLPPVAIAATVFVSVYTDRGLAGCAGARTEDPFETLPQAIAAALRDPRGARGDAPIVRLEASMPRRPRPIAPEELVARMALGTHGIALEGTDAALLPDVALLAAADAARMLELLAAKAGRAIGERDRLFLFETARVIATRDRIPAGRGYDAAIAWLAGIVQEDGSLVHAIDARDGRAAFSGEMHLARAAIGIRALAESGDFPDETARAQKRLEADLDAYEEPDRVRLAITRAHATYAGVSRGLEEAASWPELLADPWASGQVAFAIARDGEKVPEPLRAACTVHATAHATRGTPLPWTALFAGASHDAELQALTTPPLVRALGAAGSPGAIPQTATTAIAIEALAGSADPAVRRVTARAMRWLRSMQCTKNRVAAIDLRSAAGAFLATPITPLLRVDVTAHAAIALSPHAPLNRTRASGRRQSLST